MIALAPLRRLPLPESELDDPEYLYVADSTIAGQGLFTARPFRPREVICIIAGEVIDAAETARREAAGNVYIFWNSDDAYIDTATHPRLRYINHACDSNAVVEGRDDGSLWLVACRDIPSGSELTIDYDFPGIYELCRRLNPRCRAPSCRSTSVVDGEAALESNSA